MSNNAKFAYDYSYKVAVRFTEIMNNNKLFIEHELKIFEAIAEKYNLLTISEYAKKEGISYNTAVSRVNSNKVMTVKIKENIFIAP